MGQKKEKKKGGKNRITELFDAGSDITGAAAGSFLASLTGDPAAIAIGGASGALLTGIGNHLIDLMELPSLPEEDLSRIEGMVISAAGEYY